MKVRVKRFKQCARANYVRLFNYRFLINLIVIYPVYNGNFAFLIILR
jgi:hypothetical protein